MQVFHTLLNDLRTRIIGNYEILEKDRVWVDTYPGAWSSFNNLNFANGSSKTRKSRCRTFPFPVQVFINYLIFFQNILSRIAWERKNFFSWLDSVPFQLQVFYILYNFKAFLSI